MRAIFLPVAGKPIVVNQSFPEMQAGVGGYVENIRLGLQPNPHTPELVVNMRGGAILGDFYIVRHKNGDDVAVTDKDVRRWVA